MSLSEADLDKRVKEFFLKNPAGQKLLERWESRVTGYIKELISCDDPAKIKLLQAKIQYHREVMHEIL